MRKHTDEYSRGEPAVATPENGSATSIARLWPYNTAVNAIDKDWISFDSDVVKNRIIDKMTASITQSCMEFLDEFHPDLQAAVSVATKIARAAGAEHDLVSQFCLSGNDATSNLASEMSEVIRYLALNMLKSQAQLDFGSAPFEFDEAKEAFLRVQVDCLRNYFSGKGINQPFGIETHGTQSEVIAFRGRFDTHESEPPPATQCSGTARVDGFRDSGNAVYLMIVDDNLEVIDDSRTFLVICPDLIEKALSARSRRLYVSFAGTELYSAGAKKPTFHLEKLTVIEQEGPAY